MELRVSPSADIIDSQTVKAPAPGARRGYDAAKKTVGRKRHIVVDTDGRLLMLNLTPADLSDSAGLVHELLEARDEKRLLRLQRQLAGYKLLIIDELGYVPLSPSGAELLFEVFSQRYERGSTIVT